MVITSHFHTAVHTFMGGEPLSHFFLKRNNVGRESLIDLSMSFECNEHHLLSLSKSVMSILGNSLAITWLHSPTPAIFPSIYVPIIFYYDPFINDIVSHNL